MIRGTHSHKTMRSIILEVMLLCAVTPVFLSALLMVFEAGNGLSFAQTLCKTARINTLFLVLLGLKSLVVGGFSFMIAHIDQTPATTEHPQHQLFGYFRQGCHFMIGLALELLAIGGLGEWLSNAHCAGMGQ